MIQIKSFIKKHISNQLILTLLSIFLLMLIINYINKFQSHLNLVFSLLKPVFYGYIFAFLIYPFIKNLEKIVKYRFLSIIIFFLLFFLFIALFLIYLSPIIYGKLTLLIEPTIMAINETSDLIKTTLHVNLKISTNFKEQIITNIFFNQGIFTTIFNTLNNFLELLSKSILYLIFGIYFLYNYENINYKITNNSKIIHHNLPIYFERIFEQLNLYMEVHLILMIIQIIINIILLLFLNHPQWLILSLLSGISCFIPYLGPLTINILMILTAINFSINKMLLLIIGIFIVSNLDQYLITPKIYSKHIQISFIWIIFGFLVLAKLFNIIGVILTIPILIIIKVIMETYKNLN